MSNIDDQLYLEGERDLLDDVDDIDFDMSEDDFSDSGVVVFSDYEDGEDDFDEDYDQREALRLAGNFRSKKKMPKLKLSYKRAAMRMTNRELDPVVRMNLSQANEAFVRGDLQVALNLYLEVIKQDNKNFNAYKTLGEIYKSQGRLHECCNYWFLAAGLNLYDAVFWAQVAELSAELGYIDQATYCYSRAIAADPNKNPEYIMERALLYKEKKQYGRALEGFQRIFALFPTDSNVVKNLALIYVEQKRLNDAINLYMNILDQNMHPTGKQVPEFGWAELNILCELYVTQRSFHIGIKVIKLVARWLQGRQDEKWWDDQDVDAEFDSRRLHVLENRLAEERDLALNKDYDLPIDIRFKLGVLRLGLDHKSEALVHFGFLLDETEDIADLHLEAGKALEALGYNSEALVYLERAYEVDEERTVDLLQLIGKCHLELGNYAQARQIYSKLSAEVPDNLDYKLALTEVLFHLGQADEASRLLKQVSKTAKATGVTEDKSDELPAPDDPSPLIMNSERGRRNARPSPEEKLEIENNAKRKVLEKFHRMQRLQTAVDKGDVVAATAWNKLASQLVEMFMGVRYFFPRDKNRLFKGIVLYKKKKEMGLDEKLARMYNLYEGMGETDTSRAEMASVTEFRGLTFDQWFFVFVQYAILLHRAEYNTEYAIQIIDVCQNISVFIQDKHRTNVIKFVRVMLSMSQEDFGGAMNHVRHFLISNQFSPHILKIFMCCFASGIKAWLTFSNPNHQKFFLRHLKAYDSIVSNTKISGRANITIDENLPVSHGHLQLLYIYANLLGGTRSVVSSIVYLNRAYKDYHQDPMVCFVLGLAHVHRAMQRLSGNRHLQLLQGISYLLEYKELRSRDALVYEKQEIDFNFGRLFHMLGLPTIAVRHYEQVLEYVIPDLDYDLLVEAAHNLSLIYVFSGNTALARKITDKYLTI